jgi:hypothetical protein
MIRPTIVLMEVKTSQIARQVICGAGVVMPDMGVRVVAGIRRITGALVVVIVGQKLGIEQVPTVWCNMPPIVTDLTLGALAVAVVLMVTTVIATIVLVTTDRLAAMGSGVALANIWAAIDALPGLG